MRNDELKELLTLTETAGLLGVSKQTVMLWTRKGMLPKRKAGRNLYYLPRDITKLLGS